MTSFPAGAVSAVSAYDAANCASVRPSVRPSVHLIIKRHFGKHKKHSALVGVLIGLAMFDLWILGRSWLCKRNPDDAIVTIIVLTSGEIKYNSMFSGLRNGYRYHYHHAILRNVIESESKP